MLPTLYLRTIAFPKTHCVLLLHLKFSMILMILNQSRKQWILSWDLIKFKLTSFWFPPLSASITSLKQDDFTNYKLIKEETDSLVISMKFLLGIVFHSVVVPLFSFLSIFCFLWSVSWYFSTWDVLSGSAFVVMLFWAYLSLVYTTISFSFKSIQCWCYFWFMFSDEKVPTELKKAIMQARQDKKLTQAQLAQV